MFNRKILLSGVNQALYANPDECTKVDVVKNFIFAIKSALETDSVAIRLFEGNDFPFYTTLGFTNTFVEAEKYLCPHALKGKDPKDWPEDSCLECICGTVVSGKAVANMGNTSGNGSFWTSNASSDLAMVCPDGKIKLRGTCLSDGYESICVTQIKWNEEIIGVLQIEDKQQGVFNDENVTLVEDLCSCLGEVLGPLITAAMEEAEKEKIFLDNMVSIAKELSKRIRAL